MIEEMNSIFFKVNTVHFYCRSLTQIASTWLDSLAHTESITDATNDIEHTENNKQC